MASIKDKLSFRTGAILSHQAGFLLSGVDRLDAKDVAHTVILQWDNAEPLPSTSRIPWTAGTVCVAKLPQFKLIGMSEEGDFFSSGADGLKSGRICSGVNSGDDRRPFSSVDNVCGRAFAVGTRGMVYRWEGDLNWSRVDNGTILEDFEAAAGFAEDEIYFFGWKGCICRFDGRSWANIASPTNVILTSACCSQDQFVYCVGQKGTILRGRRDRWDVVAVDQVGDDLWDIVEFDGSLFISSASAVMRLKGDNIEFVEFPNGPPETFYHLSAADGILWSIGSKDLFAFDGKAWSRIY
jgi:hypothetical protein